MFKKGKLETAIKKEKKFLKSKGFKNKEVRYINGFARDVAVNSCSQLIVLGITGTFELAGTAIGTGVHLAGSGIKKAAESVKAAGAKEKKEKADKKSA